MREIISKKSKKTKERKIDIDFGEITWTLLAAIARTPEALANAFLNHGALGKSLATDEEFLSDRLIEYLRNLKRSGYIEMEKNNDSVSVRLTTKGKIKHLENSPDETTDGRIRIISYDIPENYKKKRQQFCRSLKRIGFCKLQKSLWVCNYVKADEIDLIIDELGLKKFVAYFIIEKSNIDEYIKNLLSK
ncbi:MAG: Repressor in ring oxydation complex/phenylacetic acid degradation pathway related protein (PaaX) [Candidatus Berkelbacteria bacterium Athens1014_28]|uniref:Repressor in ring oxydation complex/phenylacetic acid degradation pathway related protein (PaaX) n=1 Tax=Candidatus Berkelbacteria bacterium Athens1014_28 TaxID=2017145 RepID=A0A554LJH1_9BACT|nr:MAG: Repressor in ring oxydation complex/phenylacetic acid degradation pathway related protein (PaaX) [Candidatus Berkelbacteria bacterium Athens1014_28]